MDVAAELLPGRGVVHEFVTDEGAGVSVHAARDGTFELYTRCEDDRDTYRWRLRLTGGEAQTVATIFTARR
ncbi:K+/H+ antiporter YhaU regulatory subunit KhtT [Saccharopolyspora lacisalsi]|uniref:K+/H+ antiporter YhaU regulatory subunit KhtT n=1 Tax=Halosaccharopolyspora lacisalsi TaxID=1000566 RepID=A0A839DTB3_9PSEU|nr:hypothetical protein [Halosaccharopolyspora lacisalsi]MBA8824180.1 K+/H+ antiporter YhaU regulatory subunit KhtT [Halosaccharopolyspora lacisalsi]